MQASPEVYSGGVELDTPAPQGQVEACDFDVNLEVCLMLVPCNYRGLGQECPGMRWLRDDK
jgi:hypothetical protein